MDSVVEDSHLSETVQQQFASVSSLPRLRARLTRARGSKRVHVQPGQLHGRERPVNVLVDALGRCPRRRRAGRSRRGGGPAPVHNFLRCTKERTGREASSLVAATGDEPRGMGGRRGRKVYCYCSRGNHERKGAGLLTVQPSSSTRLARAARRWARNDQAEDGWGRACAIRSVRYQPIVVIG